LDISSNDKITDDVLKPLVNLRTLAMNRASKITGLYINRLSMLTSLDISYSRTFDPHYLYQLTTNLTHLDAGNFLSMDALDDSMISRLTNLKSLSVALQLNLTENSISRLTNLTHLDIADNENISFDTIKSLTKLCLLHLSNGSLYHYEEIHDLLTISGYDRLQLLSPSHSLEGW
jgi:Leucine-rich repeat (LRR) protein